ncbi:MAG: holo-ACP synthase, partial [Candidatus Puniceispirillaceae bacterium]
MILGIGTDIVDERRIGKSMERFGDRFLHRIFTEAERSEAARRGQASLY